MNQETRLKKANLALMRHPETAMFSGIIMMGKSEVIDDCPTAYTDGVNKKYGRKFLSTLDDSEIRALVLHENLHVALKHVGRFGKKMKENAQLMNASADYVVNDVIVSLEDKTLCKLPQGGLINEKYHNWSVNDVYKDLKKEQEEGGEPDTDTLDEHGFGEGEGQQLTPEQERELSTKIDQALREGGIMASRLGNPKTPKAITDILQPMIDWKDVLRDFVTNAVRGADEYSWRRYNKRLLANDMYLPSTVSESVGELVVAIDLSGSIGSELGFFVSELKSVCEMCNPEVVKVLWWDTAVSGIQTFTDIDYAGLETMLKPTGGGGTDPSCIPEYLSDNNINAEAIVVFTDGWFSTPKWDIATPTLWVTTEREDNIPSNGKVVKQIL
jgi:predicted metal-dependent peptidase